MEHRILFFVIWILAGISGLLNFFIFIIKPDDRPYLVRGDFLSRLFKWNWLVGVSLVLVGFILFMFS